MAEENDLNHFTDGTCWCGKRHWLPEEPPAPDWAPTSTEDEEGLEEA